MSVLKLKPRSEGPGVFGMPPQASHTAKSRPAKGKLSAATAKAIKAKADKVLAAY